MPEEQATTEEQAAPEEGSEDRPLNAHEKNWVIHLYCSIPYHEVRKLEDGEEKDFLLSMAVLMKKRSEEQQATAAKKEADMQQQLAGMTGGLIKP